MQMVITRKILLRITLTLTGLWLVLLGVLYISSGKYFDTAIRALGTQLNNRLATEIHIRKSNVHLSFIKSFPHAVIELDSLLIRSAPGLNQKNFKNFGADTLLYAERLGLVFDLASLLSDSYSLREVKVQRGKLFLLNDSENHSNYDIFKKSVGDTATGSFEMDLQEVLLEDMLVVYWHSGSKLQLKARVKDAAIQGNFSNRGFRLRTDVNTSFLSYRKGDFTLQHPGIDRLGLRIEEVDNQLLFRDIDLRLYGIPIQGDGEYIYADDTYKFQLATHNAPMKKFGDSFSALYQEFIQLQPLKGNMDLDVRMNGKGTNTPYYRIGYSLQQAEFREPESRIKLEEVYARGWVTNGQKRCAATSSVQVDTLYCRSGNSYLALSGTMKNFKTPDITAVIKGDISLNKLQIIPAVAQRFVMEGRVLADFRLNGWLPSFTKLAPASLKQVRAWGTITFNEAGFISKEGNFPESVVNGICQVKSLSELQLEGLKVRTGNSRLNVSGMFNNLPFFKRGIQALPEIRCSIEAAEFHVEDFMVRNTREEEAPYVLQLPDSMKVSAQISVEKFYYGRFEASDVQGRMQYSPGKLQVNDFELKSMGGGINSNFVIEQNAKKINTRCSATISNVDVRELFYDFHDFGQDIITHEYLKGKLSGTVQVDAAWTQTLEPLYEELEAQSQIRIDQGELIHYPTLMSLSDFIAVEELEHIRFEGMETRVTIANEKVYIPQTRINSSALSLNASGEHDFSNCYTYRFQVYLADVLWKRAQRNKPRNTEFGYVQDDGLGRTMLPLIITGVDTTFKVSYDRTTARSNIRQKLKEERNTWQKLLSEDPEQKTNEEFYEASDNTEEIQERTDEKKQSAREADTPEDEFQILWEDE